MPISLHFSTSLRDEELSHPGFSAVEIMSEDVF